jgi:hypothetical protein
MIVYQTNHEGVYVGPVEADPSPLEPGVWLVPGGAVEHEPPALAEGERARWVGSAWEVLPPPEPEPEPEQPEPQPATSCGPAQAKIVLWGMGLLDQVEAMVAAHPYRPVSIWYAAATVWERYHPYVMALGYELDLTDEDMDALFALAVTK